MSTRNKLYKIWTQKKISGREILQVFQEIDYLIEVQLCKTCNIHYNSKDLTIFTTTTKGRHGYLVNVFSYCESCNLNRNIKIALKKGTQQYNERFLSIDGYNYMPEEHYIFNSHRLELRTQSKIYKLEETKNWITGLIDEQYANTN